jgi:hypothetical protein
MDVLLRKVLLGIKGKSNFSLNRETSVKTCMFGHSTSGRNVIHESENSKQSTSDGVYDGHSLRYFCNRFCSSARHFQPINLRIACLCNDFEIENNAAIGQKMTQKTIWGCMVK